MMVVLRDPRRVTAVFGMVMVFEVVYFELCRLQFCVFFIIEKVKLSFGSFNQNCLSE